ncbi:amidohydrolase family protein [Steroidobacter cummioxidans]|uniref:amidohydrolase family protein n=1 Tax=Steroidobacter cummioxidans TaxID=1803913 RepID=UPI00137AFFC3|nr:amidohydrolase family protein [Steroidobacter cummioxidans]
MNAAVNELPAPAQVIDVCGVHYDLAGWEAYLLGFARDAPEYLTKFAPRLCSLAGADLSKYREYLQASPERAVLYLLEQGGSFDQPFDEYAAALPTHIVHTVLQGCAWRSRDGRSANDYIAACARKMPDRFTAWAGVSLRDPEAAVRELHRCVKELGMRGVTLIPFWDGVAASDPSCKSVYDAALELQLPLWIHTGHHFSARVPLELAHWRHIDAVASAYPQLTLVLGHGAWPWVAEAVSLCLRHSNVYLEFSSHRPAYMSRAGSGWEPMLFHAAGALRDRVLFGTSAWTSQQSVEQLAAETQALPIPPQIASKWLAGNALRALGPLLPAAP